MKRLHIHVSVRDLDASIRFYSQLFAAGPTVRKPDYAKWMLEDPRVNFAISQRDRRPGVQHLGIQVEDRGELAEIYERLQRAEGRVIEQGETTCCYAQSEKSWIEDPQGVQWETFLTTGASAEYGTDEIRPKPAATRCCASDQRSSDLETKDVHRGKMRDPTWRTDLTTCCSSAPGTPRAASLPRP